jgi:ribonucleoside-diphosphate reductase beta chain
MANLTDRTDERFVLYPIKHQKIWDMYKTQMASFWTAEEVPLTTDLADWQKLTKNEKHFISYVLAFFAGSDGIVSENLCTRFSNEITIPEIRYCLNYQNMMEGIHGEMYSLMIDTYITDPEEKEKLLNGISTIPIVAKKADWAKKWLHSDAPLEERLIAFAAVEGIFFSSSFCSIYWLKKRNIMVTGLGLSNEFISRDESQHTKLTCQIYAMSDNKLPEKIIHEIISDAVAIECEFAEEAIPVSLIGINSKLMIQYIKFVADRLLEDLNCKKLYNVENPFDFMEMISLNNKTNFFEKRVAEYQKAGVRSTIDGNKFSMDADF